MALPTFIIFGTRKAGTTSLYHYLDQHPEIFMSNQKGSRFFNYDPEKPDLGHNLPVKNIIDYENLFEGAHKTQAKAIGEVTPSYIYNTSSATRINEILPNALLVASLRNPVDKIYSYYQMEMRRRKVSEQIPFTIDNLGDWIKYGYYYKQLKNYYEKFSSNQIKIIAFEEWIKDSLSMLKDLYSYLGVDAEFIPNMNIKYNVGGQAKNPIIASVLKHRKIYIKVKPYVPRSVRSKINKYRNMNMMKVQEMPGDVRRHLGELFLQDIEALERLVNKDLSIWKNANS